jgi:putative spermidine/putrescine transport system ATP-binding protein
VFQSYSLFPNMTALENVGFGLRMRKLNGATRHRKAAGSLTRVTVLLSGDVQVKVDKPSTAAASLAPGTSVQVQVAAGEPVLVAASGAASPQSTTAR